MGEHLSHNHIKMCGEFEHLVQTKVNLCGSEFSPAPKFIVLLQIRSRSQNTPILVQNLEHLGSCINSDFYIRKKAFIGADICQNVDSLKKCVLCEIFWFKNYMLTLLRNIQ